MTLVDDEAFTATSLGFPPYKRSHLPSKTYQAFARIFHLSDQQSSQISPSPPLKSGTTTQEEEENRLVGNEAKDRVENEQSVDTTMPAPAASDQIAGHVGVEENSLKDSVGGQLSDGKLNVDERNVVEVGRGGGAHEQGKEVVDNTNVEEGKISEDIVGSADLEEGEISGGMVETNLSDDHVVGDCVGVDDRTREEHVQKDEHVEQQEGRHENSFSLVGKGNSRDNPSPRQVKGSKSVLGRRKTAKVKQIEVFDLMHDTIQSKNDVRKTKESTKSDSLKHTGANSESVVLMNDGKASSANVVEAGVQKKRVITEERRARKKANRRRKRAEEDRKSGVKRMKLQPISKPKEVVHCKYHIKGKCQQGDACKFSHDITPLTKSKPCNFFALRQCLKGKDCPYDHDLFKYPCDNFKSTGFCSRGDECLFSHKIPLENDTQASDCNKISADSGKHSAKGSTSQQALNVSTNTSPTTPSPLKTINRFPGKSVVEMKTPAQAPKGISFLSFGKASSETPSKQQKYDLPAIGDNGASLGGKNQGGSEKFDNSIEKSGKMLVTTQSLSQPPKRATGGQNKFTFNIAQRESSLDSQFALKWGDNEAPATAGAVAGGWTKNICNSALRVSSLDSQFASKWGNLAANAVPEAPTTVGPVAAGQNKNISNSFPGESSSTCQFASKWGNAGASTAHKAPVTAGPAAGGHNKNMLNSVPREPSPTSQLASKRTNLASNSLHVTPANAGPVAASNIESKVTGRSVQSTAINIPSISSILQEFM